MQTTKHCCKHNTRTHGYAHALQTNTHTHTMRTRLSLHRHVPAAGSTRTLTMVAVFRTPCIEHCLCNITHASVTTPAPHMHTFRSHYYDIFAAGLGEAAPRCALWICLRACVDHLCTGAGAVCAYSYARLWYVLVSRVNTAGLNPMTTPRVVGALLWPCLSFTKTKMGQFVNTNISNPYLHPHPSSAAPPPPLCRPDFHSPSLSPSLSPSIILTLTNTHNTHTIQTQAPYKFSFFPTSTHLRRDVGSLAGVIAMDIYISRMEEITPDAQEILAAITRRGIKVSACKESLMHMT